MARIQVKNHTDLDPEICESRITDLLDKVPLLSLATATAEGHAYANTAFFATMPDLSIILWTSPETTHAKNLRTNSSAAATVFDSDVEWGNEVRGAQLFGSCSIADEQTESIAFESYAARFPKLREWAANYDDAKIQFQSRFYVLKVQRIRLLDEQFFGREFFIDAAPIA